MTSNDREHRGIVSLRVACAVALCALPLVACGGPVDSDGEDGGGENQTGTSEQACGDSPRFDVAKLVNDARDEEGLDPLICDQRLVQAADAHAEDMCDNDFLGHNSSDGRTAADRIRTALDGEVTWLAENVAGGAMDAQSVHDLWMNSPGHRGNILAEPAVRIGVGYAPCENQPRWVQKFAAP